MRKLLVILVFLTFAPLAYGQACTGTGLVWSCPNNTTTADINTMLASGTFSDGAVVTFAAGTYNQTIAFPKFSNSKGATFQCATSPPSGTTSITAWSITGGNTVTFTATNSLAAGNVVDLSGFGTSTFFNNASVTVIATGLSGSQFEASFNHANGSGTESGTATVNGAAADAIGCVINAHVNGTSSSSVFGTDALSGNNTHFYRISGFIFDGGGSTVSPSFGMIYFDAENGNQNATMSGTAGNGGLRIDHNTFRNAKTGAQMFLCGAVPGFTNTTNCYGVIDHNAYSNATTLSMAISVGNMPNPLPSASSLGTAKNLFMENNSLAFVATGNTSAEGCIDNWIGPYVARHNKSTNCLWLNHGETHLGGPINFEFYNNDGVITDTTTGVGDCNEFVHTQGAGTAMFFNNTCRPASGHTNNGFQVQQYRGGAGTAGNTFSVTGVTISGSTATYTGTFSSAPNGWYNFSGFGNAGNNTFTQITSSTATTLTGTTARSLGTQVTETHAATANFSSQDGSAPQCDGTVASPSTLIWATGGDGNRSPIGTNHGYPCFNQPGRDLAGNIQPWYFANNLFSDTLATLPAKFGSVGGILDFFAAHMQNQREWFDEVGNVANSGCPGACTPFDGTTGSGWGTLAQRPTTCTSNTTENAFGHGTSGVGYYATDQGTQGTWYKCISTNTWSSFYTPFTYPHPLVSGTGQANTPTFAPGAGTYVGGQTVTISTTTPSAIICWNTTGSPATNGAGTACNVGTLINGSSGNITVSVSETVFAVAGTASLTDSNVGSATYVINAQAPPASCPTCFVMVPLSSLPPLCNQIKTGAGTLSLIQ